MLFGSKYRLSKYLKSPFGRFVEFVGIFDVNLWSNDSLRSRDVCCGGNVDESICRLWNYLKPPVGWFVEPGRMFGCAQSGAVDAEAESMGTKVGGDIFPSRSRCVHDCDLPSRSRCVQDVVFPSPSRCVHKDDSPSRSRYVSEVDFPSRSGYEHDVVFPSRSRCAYPVEVDVQSDIGESKDVR